VKGEEAGDRKWNMRESRKGNEKERGGESGGEEEERELKEVIYSFIYEEEGHSYTTSRLW
jgi:hypothetical protein